MLRHTYTKEDTPLGNAHEHGMLGATNHGLAPAQLAAIKAQQSRGATRGNKGRIGKALPGHVPSTSGRQIMPVGVHNPTASTIGKGAVQKLAAPQANQYKAGTNFGKMAPKTKDGKPMFPNVPQLKKPAVAVPKKGKVKSKKPKLGKTPTPAPTPQKENHGNPLDHMKKAGQQFMSTAKATVSATKSGAAGATSAALGGSGAAVIGAKGEH